MANDAYWLSPVVQAHCVEVAKMLFGVSIGFFFYDVFLSAKFDWSIITGKRQRRLPQLAYFACKFLLFCYFIVNFIVLYAQKEINCMAALEMVEMLMGFTVICSSILLACRTVCVYEGPAQVLVSVTLGILTCGLGAAWMANVTAVSVSWVPGGGAAWTEGGCVWTAVKDDYWVKYVCTIVFDGIVLFLTIFGLVQMSGPSHIGAVLLRQGIVYFILTFIANLMITILTLLKLSPTMSLILAIPQTTTCVLCACRLYINLADEARQAHEASQQSISYADRLKYTGGGSGSGSGSGGQTSTNSSSSKPKSRKARFANYLLRKDGGVTNTAVPSYFSSTSVARAQTGLSEGSTPPNETSSEDYHERRMNRSTTNQNTISNRGNQQTRTIPGSQSSNEDLEKQAGRSTNTLDDQFYDSRSTAEGIPQTPQEDDEVTMQQRSFAAPPVSQSRHQLGARVPPRNSSGNNNSLRQTRTPFSAVHRDDGVQVETVNYVVVEDAPAYTPSAYIQQPQPSRSQYTSPRLQNDRRPGTAEGRPIRQYDDEISQPSSRFAVRKEAPRS